MEDVYNLNLRHIKVLSVGGAATRWGRRWAFAWTRVAAWGRLPVREAVTPWRRYPEELARLWIQEELTRLGFVEDLAVLERFPVELVDLERCPEEELARLWLPEELVSMER